MIECVLTGIQGSLFTVGWRYFMDLFSAMAK